MIRLKKARYCWPALGLGLLLGSGNAWGAPAVAGAALVYAVRGRAQAAGFVVPQVRLASAAAMRRLNHRLAGLVLADLESDTLATLPQQLQQAARSCCYDATERQWTVGQGVIGTSYEVLLNAGDVLSVAYTLDINGAYSWQQTRHATFDLRTGRQLSLAELVADPPSQLQARLRGAINRRIGETLAETAADYGDSAEVADLAERWNWNKVAHRVQFAEEGKEGAAPPDLTDFAFTKSMLLLFYSPSLPHAILNFAPDDTYRFPYARLHPQPLLKRSLPPATAQKSSRLKTHRQTGNPK